MEAATFEKAKSRLLARRQEILALHDKTRADEDQWLSEREIDWTDQAMEEGNVDLLERLGEKELSELKEIGQALQRIELNTYGVCEDCGDDIAAERLEAVPWTRLCIDCAEDAERRARQTAQESQAYRH